VPELVPATSLRQCKILGLNAADFYGFDLGLLAPIAQRIGPTVEDIHTALAGYPDGSTLDLFIGGLPSSVG
jgi:hypothetical protein